MYQNLWSIVSKKKFILC